MSLATLEQAREWLAQAEALIYHQEYEPAALAAYEAAAAAARVPLYRKLVDPFTAEEALWEFENLFVLSGQTQGAWEEVSSKFEALKKNVLPVTGPNEVGARMILDEARSFVSYCAQGKFSETGAA